MSSAPSQHARHPTLADVSRASGPSPESWATETLIDEPDSFEALLAAAVCPADDAPDRTASAGGELPAGARIEDRFVVERFAGAGGMGAVYRCFDEQTQRRVALKVLRGQGGQYAGRFRREASVLGALTHPAIVRYVAHGCTDDGMPYLAMQWLEGEDLAERLLRGRLPVSQSVTLGRRMCQGIAAAHARGFLHRDLKPSNVFLVEGKVSSAKLLDFGLAHRRAGTQTLTRAGTILGTVGYMAPEQAAGGGSRDPRGDLFSIGCVLYECLTGQPAFKGDNYLAVLDSVMRTEVPRVSSLCPGVPPELDELLASLLSKTPDARPARASIVARQLGLLEQPTRCARRGHERHAPRVLRAPPTMEVIVALALVGGDHGERSLAAAVQEGRSAGLEPVGLSSRFCTLSLGASDALHLIDRTECALQWALQARRDHPALDISVVTSLMDRRAGRLASDAIERALLRRPIGPVTTGITADDLTLALLDPTSRVVHTPLPGGANVTALVKNDDELCDRAARNLQGRDKELLLLEATLSECVADVVARVVVLHGEPKIGKTCLARAFVSRISAQGLAASVVLCGDSRERDEPLAFLHRLLGPSAMPASVRGQQPERAVLRAWLAAMTRCKPLVLVLEDAQWIDVASLRCIAASLEGWSDRSLLVLALTRPDGRPGASEAWRDVAPQEIVLRRVTDRVARRWVTGTLGPDASNERIARAVLLADGKPRLLHALTRAGDGESSALPEAALALAQDDLTRLPPPMLRVMRAASVFGSRFRAEGVRAILGDRLSSTRRSLEELVRRGSLAVDPDSHEGIHTFKTALLEHAARRLLRPDELHLLHARVERWRARSAAGGSTIGDL